MKIYNEEMEKELVYLYLYEGLSVYELADIFARKLRRDITYRSIISKLVKLNVYKAEPKNKKRITTSKTLVRELENILNVNLVYKDDGMININSKENLQIILNGLKEKL